MCLITQTCNITMKTKHEKGEVQMLVPLGAFSETGPKGNKKCLKEIMLGPE